MFGIIKTQWDNTSTTKRIVFVIATGVLFLMFFAGAYWVMRDDYQVLFSDLNAQDASAMVSELDKLKVPYQLTDNGTTILVDRESVYKTRLKLMGKGLNLNGSVGFEIFNNSEFGMTEFAQKVNYQRALQGELARTIMAFDEIKSARVHLVLPESGLFKRQNAKPKASVSVVVKDDSVLTSDQVIGIQRLVAASVPEINAAEVTVVDQRGIAVTKSTAAPDGDLAVADRLDMKKKVEDYLIKKVLAIADRAVGEGKAIVSVDATLNYDQVKVTKKEIFPLANTSGQDVGAVTKRRESLQGGEAWNDPNNSFQSKPTMTSTPNSTFTETEYVNGNREEQVLVSQGALSRLSVGVLVPNMADPVKLAKLKEMVAMAVGINSTRGDALVVYEVDIPQAVSPESTMAPVVMPESAVSVKQNRPIDLIALTDMVKGKAVIVCLVLFSFLLVFLLFIKKQKAEKKRLLKEERERLLMEIMQWAGQNPK